MTKKTPIFSALQVNTVESTVNEGNAFKFGESCKGMNDRDMQYCTKNEQL